MQLAERVGHATPVGPGLRRSAVPVGHHHQTVGEQPTVCRRDRHRHSQPGAVKVLEKFGLPREVSIAPGAETTDRKAPVDPHTPHVVGNSASKPLNTSDVITPPPAKKVGLVVPEGAALEPGALATYRLAYLEAMRAYQRGEVKRPMRSWTLAFLVRHSAYHCMDHAWEMEDKDLSGSETEATG